MSIKVRNTIKESGEWAVQTTGINSKTFSVEVSHTYLDQLFSHEQEQSVRQFQHESQGWTDAHYEIVLFDDYNIKGLKVTHDEVLEKLKSLHVSPRYYAFEKDMIAYVPQLLDSILVPKIKRQYETYIDRSGRYPCSLLTAVWYLVRLGHITDTNRALRVVDDQDNFEPANELVNFLPRYFSEVENKAKKLIQATAFHDSVNCIKNIYFDADISAISSQKVLD
ncbi:MAG TPA: hypothetical protein VGE13_00920 [Candidatus Saccharimonadales bacterium]